MNQAGLSRRPAVVEGLLQGVQNKVCMGGAGGSPSDDPSGEGVDHERHKDEAGPCGDTEPVNDFETPTVSIY